MQNDKTFAVYILANQNNRVLYIGVTNNLERRIFEHKSKTVKGFTYKYNVDRLVYFEQTENAESAILREKQIKSYNRSKKDTLVNTMNPEWIDMSR